MNESEMYWLTTPSEPKPTPVVEQGPPVEISEANATFYTNPEAVAEARDGPRKLTRLPTYLSHSGLKTFEKEPTEWFMRYAVPVKAERPPQMDFMSVGSAFDAYVKSKIVESLFGKGVKPEFEFQAIFEQQVEEHNRDFALKAGEHCLETYVESGFYDELLDMLEESLDEPTFETTESATILGIPMTGKPDCKFTHSGGRKVILDWKVKGYCSKWSPSPSKGYRLCRDGFKAKKQSKSHGKSHKDYLPMIVEGDLEINELPFECGNVEYADQLSLYGWLLGEKPGDDSVVVMIDELVWKYAGSHNPPVGRVANHRGTVSRKHQQKLLERFRACWDACQTGYVFKQLTRAENDARCDQLERTALHMQTSGTEEDLYVELTR